VVPLVLALRLAGAILSLAESGFLYHDFLSEGRGPVSLGSGLGQASEARWRQTSLTGAMLGPWAAVTTDKRKQ
jgi:hypothetical protein